MKKEPDPKNIKEKLRIGTSGYSFKDWKGVFYPDNLKQGDWLNYYSRFFSAVEINSSYYRIPHYKVFENLDRKTPQNFEFIVKLHKSATHIRRDYQNDLHQLHGNLLPLRESGKFSGFLAQFPYSFKNNQTNRQYLRALREQIPEESLFVEFRHNSWSGKPVYEFLHSNRIGYVCVDEPQLRGLLPPQQISTIPEGYIRMHGRNKLTWWDSSRGDRYDYHYSVEELKEWKTRIEEMLDQVKKIYLFFNNCHHGQAAQNALQMIDLCGI